MTDLYREALADKRKVLEVAEQNATKKIVASVAPKIKAMIESQLLSELSVDDASDEDDILLDFGLETASELPPEDSMVNDDVEELPFISADPMDDPMDVADVDVSGGEDAGVSLPDGEGKVTLDMDSLSPDSSGEEDEYELTGESVDVLKSLFNRKDVNTDRVELRCIKMQEALNNIIKAKASGKDTIKNNEIARQIKLECESHYTVLRESTSLNESQSSLLQNKLEKVYNTVMEHYSTAGHFSKIISLVKETNRAAGKLSKRKTSTENDLKEYVVGCFKLLKTLAETHPSLQGLYESATSDDSVDKKEIQQVEEAISKLYKEIRHMTRKKGKLINEGEVVLKLGLPDELGEFAADDIQVSVVPAEEGMEDMGDMDDELDLDSDESMGDADDDALEEEDYLLNVELPGVDDDEDMSGIEVGLAGDDEADADMEDMDMDMEDMDMDDDMGPDLDDEEAMGESLKLKDDDIIEIDEAALVREIRRMKALREEKYKVKHGGMGPGKDLSSFGGGKGEGDQFVDGEDLNASDEAGGSEGYLEEGELSELDDIDEACDEDEEGVEDVKESRARRALAKNARAKQLAANKARKELAETKLLNTKLVALNRLLQVPGLNKNTKEQIVESLDKGRSSAEVEKLYAKIVTALKKKRGAVNESTNRSVLDGRSSRTTTSGSPKNEGADPLVGRWAKIAGIDQLNG